MADPQGWTALGSIQSLRPRVGIAESSCVFGSEKWPKDDGTLKLENSETLFDAFLRAGLRSSYICCEYFMHLIKSSPEGDYYSPSPSETLAPLLYFEIAK
ncbi:MAG: hypothetical protein EZS28_028462 [Streblomastix strix]|uniref:Uncharacterized protein n=1 Tax=Streblomastix strix TaxID=222440 RepID=A0A5J4V1S9_9EUKA|nr:MAG: hypothetical protein EZS28_028462 [Streblomastix strix]